MQGPAYCAEAHEPPGSDQCDLNPEPVSFAAEAEEREQHELFEFAKPRVHPAKMPSNPASAPPFGYGEWHKTARLPQRRRPPPRSSTRPGRSPVTLPSATTITPFTSTWLIPCCSTQGFR